MVNYEGLFDEMTWQQPEKQESRSSPIAKIWGKAIQTAVDIWSAGVMDTIAIVPLLWNLLSQWLWFEDSVESTQKMMDSLDSMKTNLSWFRDNELWSFAIDVAWAVIPISRVTKWLKLLTKGSTSAEKTANLTKLTKALEDAAKTKKWNLTWKEIGEIIWKQDASVRQSLLKWFKNTVDDELKVVSKNFDDLTTDLNKLNISNKWLLEDISKTTWLTTKEIEQLRVMSKWDFRNFGNEELVKMFNKLEEWKTSVANITKELKELNPETYQKLSKLVWDKFVEWTPWWFEKAYESTKTLLADKAVSTADKMTLKKMLVIAWLYKWLGRWMDFIEAEWERQSNKSTAVENTDFRERYIQDPTKYQQQYQMVKRDGRYFFEWWDPKWYNDLEELVAAVWAFKWWQWTDTRKDTQDTPTWNELELIQQKYPWLDIKQEWNKFVIDDKTFNTIEELSQNEETIREAMKEMQADTTLTFAWAFARAAAKLAKF